MNDAPTNPALDAANEIIATFDMDDDPKIFAQYIDKHFAPAIAALTAERDALLADKAKREGSK